MSQTPAVQGQRGAPHAPSPALDQECGLKQRYSSLSHRGTAERVQNTAGGRASFSGKLSATAGLCADCRARLASHAFCSKSVGCNCVKGVDGNADCSTHGPPELPLKEVKFTVQAKRGIDFTTVCDDCTAAASVRRQTQTQRARETAQLRVDRGRGGAATRCSLAHSTPAHSRQKVQYQRSTSPSSTSGTTRTATRTRSKHGARSGCVSPDNLGEPGTWKRAPVLQLADAQRCSVANPGKSLKEGRSRVDVL